MILTNIKKRRLALGLTQAMLAKLANITQKQVSLYEREIGNPTQKSLTRIDKVLSEIEKRK